MDRQPGNSLGQHDLARQAAGAAGAGGEVEHILLHFARLGQAAEILLGDDDVAGRAGHLAFARPFERHQMRLRDVEQDIAGVRLGLGSVLAIGVDEGDAHQLPPCTRAASLIALNPSRKSRSEEHTSELQSLMRISYSVFCMKKKQYY